MTERGPWILAILTAKLVWLLWNTAAQAQDFIITPGGGRPQFPTEVYINGPGGSITGMPDDLLEWNRQMWRKQMIDLCMVNNRLLDVPLTREECEPPMPPR